MPRKPTPEHVFGPFGLIVDPTALLSGWEVSAYEKVDMRPIRQDTGLGSGLNRYPAPWLAALCRVLALPERGVKRERVNAAVARLSDEGALAQIISALPDEARRALAIAMAAGGWMKYGQLTRQVGDEGPDSYFWGERPPASAIGHLRVRGLVLVGRLAIGGRNWKVVVVPKELRPGLASVLSVPAPPS